MKNLEVDLSALNATAKPKSKSKEYPVATTVDPKLVDAFVEGSRKLKELTTEVNSVKGELRDAVLPFAVSQLHGDQKSVIIKGKSGEALFSVTDGYRSSTDLDEVPKKLRTRFASNFEIKVDGSALGDNPQAFVDALVALAQKHGVAPALSAKKVVRPVSSEVLLDGLSETEVAEVDAVVKIPTTFRVR